MFRAILGILFVPSVFAAPEPTVDVLPDIVVEGKRLRGDHRSAVVLTEAELARESGRTLGTLLRESAGVDFVESTSGNANVLVRGASGSGVLVLIDGVKANDPSATNRLFDWTRIDVRQVERIEILKGPQAVSYGSDAIGGVILVETKRGRTGATATIEAGEAEKSLRAYATYGFALGERHSLRFQALGKGNFDGRSNALPTVPGAPVEGDDSREATLGTELGSDWGGGLRSALTADLRVARDEIDDGAFSDDPNSIARNREIRSAFRLGGAVVDRTEWSALVSHLDFRRAYADEPNAGDPLSSDTIYRGRNSRVEGQARFRSEKGAEILVGSEGVRETLDIDSRMSPVSLEKNHASTLAVFAESNLPLIGSERGDGGALLATDFGARLSQFTTYGRQWSGKAGLSSMPLSGLEADVGLSTGFKAPSLYSLYAPLYGNSALKPEESVQTEAGLAYSPAPGYRFSARVFENRIRNRFGYDPATFRSLNVERADIRGVEFESELAFFRTFRFRPHVTYLSSRDRRTGGSLTDVPRWKGGAKFEWDPREEISLVLSVLAKSARASSAGSLRVPGFSRVDLSVRNRVSERWSALGRIENALDRDYQEIRGYTTPGFSAFVGVEYRE